MAACRDFPSPGLGFGKLCFTFTCQPTHGREGIFRDAMLSLAAAAGRGQVQSGPDRERLALEQQEKRDNPCAFVYSVYGMVHDACRQSILYSQIARILQSTGYVKP